MHISFYTRRGWNSSSRSSSSVVNSLGSFFMASHKSFSCLWLFPFPPRMINLKNPYLFAPPGPTNYDKATYIVSSNIRLFTCPQAIGFPWNPYPQRRISAKGVSQIHPCVSDVNFSNNISIPYDSQAIQRKMNMTQLLRFLNY